MVKVHSTAEAGSFWGRDLRSRRRQYVVRDLEIGQPFNSEECSETADGVTRESQDRSRRSLLRRERRDQPGGRAGPCVCPGPLKLVSEKDKRPCKHIVARKETGPSGVLPPAPHVRF